MIKKSSVDKYIKLLLGSIDNNNNENNIVEDEFRCAVTKTYRNIHGGLCMAMGRSYRNHNDPSYKMLGGQLAVNRCLIMILKSWKKDLNNEINNLKYLKHSTNINTGNLIDFYLLVKQKLIKIIKYLYKMNSNRINSYYPNKS